MELYLSLRTMEYMELFWDKLLTVNCRFLYNERQNKFYAESKRGTKNGFDLHKYKKLR